MTRSKCLLVFCHQHRLTSALVYSLVTFAAVFLTAPPAGAQVLRCTDARTGEVTYTDGKCPDRTVLQEVQPRLTEQEAAEQRARTAAALQEKQQRLAAEALEAQKQAEAAKAAKASASTHTPSAATYAASAECAKAKSQLQAMERDASSRATQDFIEASAAAQRQVELACLGPDRFAELEIARATQPRIVTPPAAVVQPWPYVQPGYGYVSPYGYGSRHPQSPAPVFPSVGTPTPPPRLVQCTDYHCVDNLGQKYPKYGKGRFPGNGGVCRSVGGQAPC